MLRVSGFKFWDFLPYNINPYYSFQMDLYQEQGIILNFEIFETTGRKTSLNKEDIICVSDRRIMIGKMLKT